MKIKTLKQPGFEEIVACHDEASGLQAIIAIHSTELGPSLGGIRMYPYPGEKEALQDVTRLARAMTFKNAAARLKLGGGKAVILGDPNRDKSPKLFRAMGQFVHKLGGRYYTAKDAGVITEDLIAIAQETPYVAGLPESMGGSGDPSPWTAQGILTGMRTCLKWKLKRTDFTNVKVAIQGLGHVGLGLAKLLHQEKAKLIFTDIYPAALQAAAKTIPAQTIGTHEILAVKTDILAPCALGGVINDQTIQNLNCSMIAGGSNNQLEDEAKHGRMLFEKGILYAPDFILNSGGVINIYVRDILKEKDPTPWILKIGDYLEEIFRISEDENLPPSQIANERTAALLKK